MCFHVLYEVLGHQDQSCLLDSQVNIQDTKKINKNPSFFFFPEELCEGCRSIDSIDLIGIFRILG